ncbi:MAG TPA: hypothetical protein VEN81_00755 [Planctomycetota bacterium]|nr:hypothetical protein [Planctomycetota bacterium]
MRTVWILGLFTAVAGSIALAAARPAFVEPVNDACPLCGKAVDKQKTSDVKVFFCCANCKGKFDRDPLATLGKVDRVPNEKCPLSGRPLGDAVSTVTVGLCSGECKGKFDQEPARYLAKVKAKKEGP